MEKVTVDGGESMYLATAEELSWARQPLANHAAGRPRPWRHAGDGRRKKTGRRDLFETLLKPRGFFCKITSELRPRHVFRDEEYIHVAGFFVMPARIGLYDANK